MEHQVSIESEGLRFKNKKRIMIVKDGIEIESFEIISEPSLLDSEHESVDHKDSV